ncbi:MAG: hypothetical protein B7Z80_02705 [Rhodospirillales bacterium 20-64-7]|nr:MAG: hypothetical protein B7Z80_02705 [Rhodospirillales bacterium 20-64-7]
MNQLSLMLYWAGVLDNLGPFFVIMAMVSFSLIWAVAYGSFGYGYSDDKDDMKVRRSFRRWLFIVIPLPIIFGLCAVFTPSKDTVYAMATAQVGQQVIESPLGEKAEQALEAWLDAQINKAKSSS